MTKHKTDLSRSECKAIKGLGETSPFYRFSYPRCDKSVYVRSYYLFDIKFERLGQLHVVSEIGENL